MKTKKEVDSDIKDLFESQRDSADKKKKLLQKEIDDLKTVRTYIGTNPRQEYIETEIVRIKNKIEVLESQYGYWLEVNRAKHKNPPTAYNTESGISILKKQLKTLKYIK